MTEKMNRKNEKKNTVKVNEPKEEQYTKDYHPASMCKQFNCKAVSLWID
tara:strand:+ start:284 stop:430 length:147 start_codon:yes stop_codon:yes gene_type:complete